MGTRTDKACCSLNAIVMKKHETDDHDSRDMRPLFDTEELEQRLEAAFLSFPDSFSYEPCVWACACFMVHGPE